MTEQEKQSYLHMLYRIANIHPHMNLDLKKEAIQLGLESKLVA